MAKIKIQQVRSTIKCPKVQKETMIALGYPGYGREGEAPC